MIKLRGWRLAVGEMQEARGDRKPDRLLGLVGRALCAQPPTANRQYLQWVWAWLRRALRRGGYDKSCPSLLSGFNYSLTSSAKFLLVVKPRSSSFL